MSAQETASVSARYFSHIVVLVVIGLALLTIGTPRVYAAPLCVNPGGTGGCYSHIKDAIAAASAADTITVAAGTYTENNITIDKSLTIIGAGAGSTIVDGQGLNRVFYMPMTSASISISGLTIQNGVNSGGAGGGIISAGALTLSSSLVYSNTAMSGGGIANTGTLTLTNVTISNNTATDTGGGGIRNGSSDARLNLYNVSISNNHTTGSTPNGAGISMYSGSTAHLTDVTVFANTPARMGGGIFADTGTTLIIDQSAIISNTIAGGSGAGIYNTGAATLTNVTISGNGGDVVNGGGIQNFVGGTVTLLNSTVVSNTLTGFSNGGGINNGGTSVQLKNTIVSNNAAETAGANCYNTGTIVSLGYNLENLNSCGLTGTGDLPNTNPRIGPLANHGGPTLTHALLIGSPAIDGGTNSGCPSMDQRGVRRPLGARCDIGAYEAAMLYLPLLLKNSP